jgi:hypothetical protein
MESVGDIIRKAEQNYLQGNVMLGRYVNWSMHDTIERIDAYLNSKHITGDKDSLDRDKPFFNIVTAATNIWYRATDIDRKDIRFIPSNSGSVVLAFVANVLLQKWMDDNRLGQFLNQWGRALARYGSAVVKFVEQGGDLIPVVVPWNRFIADPVQFDALPRIEKLYMTPAQLRKNALYDQGQVDLLIKAIQARRTLDKQQQDILNDFIELYEVHGEMDSRLLEEKADSDVQDKDIKYVQQMHVISYVERDNTGEYLDFTLYCGKERQDPYMLTHLIEEDGRTLAIGAVEYLFDAQWMQNHTVKNMKDTLDLASRLIFQTADTHFVGRNVLSAIETGDILIHDENKPLERVANDKPDIGALQQFGAMWNSMAQELTSTPEALRGVMPSGRTPYALQSLLTQQANSLFEIMTENKGLAIEDMMRKFIIPHLKKQLKNKDEVVAVLDDAGVQEIDSIYVPKAAVKRYNDRSKEQILSGQLPDAFNQQAEEQGVRQQMAPLGNKRFFKPDELDSKTWADLFSDFEWDSVKVRVTNENSDTQQITQTLTTVLQTIATNPLILQDPNAKMVFAAILNQTGVISPIQLTAPTAQPQPQPQLQPGQTNPTSNVPAPGGGQPGGGAPQTALAA